jgi:outer membrane receptor for ferrienterochelin and colicins
MLSKRVVWCALGILFLLAGAATAQDVGRIEGRVTGPDGSGLGGVSVRVDQTDQVALTGPDGGYSLEVAAGTYTLTFSLIDRTAAAEGVTVTAGQTVTTDKSVDWDVSYAETITVTSVSRRAERITEAPAAVTVVTEQEIEREAASGQLPKLLEFTPGVDFSQSGLYDINFNTRGFNSSLNRRILTLIDGRDPAVPFLGSQEWAAVSFPLDELQSVELVRGPGSALYGANAFNGVLNMVTKAPRGSEGGKLRLTGGDLDTRRADFRWATDFAEGWYFKAVGGYQQSEDFTRSRNQQVEYSSICTATQTADCLRREAAPLDLEEGKISFGGLRLDKYFGESVLTVEGGTANLEGPTFQTGIGRVQVTDVQRPWTRVNFNTLHWNVLGYWDSRKAEDQLALASGARLFEDSSNLHGEIQGNIGFADGRGFLVGGFAYHEQEVDTANRRGQQTLLFTDARNEDQQALFGQLEYSFTDSLKGVVALRVDDSSLHDTQYSPKGSLVYSFTPNHTVRLTYNEAFQVPNYSEFFLQVPAGAPINLSMIEAGIRRVFPALPQLGFASVPVLAIGNSDLEVEEIRSYEVGYSAILAQKVYLTLDYYQSEIENFVTDLLPGVNTAFAPYAPPAGVPAPVTAQLLAILRGALGSRFVGFTNLANGQPALVVSYANAGSVDTQGVDLAVNYYISDRWLVDASYSWFDFEVKEQALGDQLLPNAPEHKLAAGLGYTGDRFAASAKYRWVDDFRWAAGVFVGNVPSYDLVDLSASFDITENVSVGVDISNLFDDEQYQSFGGDLLSRRALGHVTLTW